MTSDKYLQRQRPIFTRVSKTKSFLIRANVKLNQKLQFLLNFLTEKKVKKISSYNILQNSFQLDKFSINHVWEAFSVIR